MLRLSVLVLLLVVVVTSSARRVEKVRRQNDVWETCFEKDHPLLKCVHLKMSDYEVIGKLSRARSPQDAKRIILEEDALTNLCSEATDMLNCASTTLQRASEECQDAYADQELTVEHLAKVSSFLRLLCTPENIRKAEDNLDCMVDGYLIQDIGKCSRVNPDHDCSEFNDSDDFTARQACYQEKYRQNCDSRAVISCAKSKAADACTQEAGDLVELAGNAFYERFPLCSGNSVNQFNSLLKYFKK